MLDPDQATRGAAAHTPPPAAVRDALGSPHLVRFPAPPEADRLRL